MVDVHRKVELAGMGGVHCIHLRDRLDDDEVVNAIFGDGCQHPIQFVEIVNLNRGAG